MIYLNKQGLTGIIGRFGVLVTAAGVWLLAVTADLQFIPILIHLFYLSVSGETFHIRILND